MRCAWSDEHAYRYAAGRVCGPERDQFESHLPACPSCRTAVAEAGGVDALLRDALVPAEPPPGLAERIAARVTATRPERQSRPLPPLFALPRLRAFSLGAAALLALALLAAALFAPSAMLALVREWLYFVPGIGITAANDATLVARAPVVVRSGSLTFTVTALLSDGKSTRVEFRLEGLPGGKEGGDANPQPAIRPGDEPPAPPQPRQKAMPSLRDASGRTYKMLSGFTGVGGSGQENVVKGEITFEPLPQDVERVDLVMPAEWMASVPALVAPHEFVASLDLVHPALGGLVPARLVNAEVAANGITLRAQSVAFTAEGTAVEVECQPADDHEQVVGLGGVNQSSDQRAILSDGRGREYRPRAWEGGIVPRPYQQSLVFPGAKGERADLRLRVDTLQVRRDASVGFRVPLAGRQAGDKFDLNASIDLAGYPVRILSAELQPGWLRLALDLGPAKNGRKLVSLQADAGQGNSFEWSYGPEAGETRYAGFPIGEAVGDVQVTFTSPVFEVTGPWQVPLSPSEP